MSLGYEVGDKEWERKKEEYLGQPRFPEVAWVDPGRTQLPLQLRVHMHPCMHAWRSNAWREFQSRINKVCHDIGVAANADQSIMPVHRNRQARSAFSLYVTECGKTDLVLEYRELRRRRVELWRACVKDALADCESSFIDEDIVERPGVRGHVWGTGVTEYLRPVHIGGIQMNGAIGDVWDGDMEWDKKCVYVWQNAE